MGEAKRKRSKREFLEDVGQAVGRELADRGRLVEAGFVIFADAVISPTAPEVQREEMRLAFMAGAEHVFSSLVNIMEGEGEGESEMPTEADLRRMDLINKELDEWRGRISERVQPSQGRA